MLKTQICVTRPQCVKKQSPNRSNLNLLSSLSVTFKCKLLRKWEVHFLGSYTFTNTLLNDGIVTYSYNLYCPVDQ